MQVERQPAENLVLFQLVGHGNLHRAIEGQVALVYPPQHFHGQLHYIVAGQHVAAELGAALFNLPGKGHLFPPREQRDFAHLRQIHSHRIVRPGIALVHAFQQALDVHVEFELVQVGGRQFGRVVADEVVFHVLESAHVVVGNIVDDVLRPRGRLVVQVIQQCVVQLQSPPIIQVSGPRSGPNVTLCHISRPKATKFYHCFF